VTATIEGDGADDMTRKAESETPTPRRHNWLVARLASAFRKVLRATIFGSLRRRIIVLNLAALAVLVVGILFLNQWRAGLIDARVQALRIQGEIIAAAVAASATVDSDLITVDPDLLLKMHADGDTPAFSFFDPALEFPISPERVAPLLRNLITPTRTRARIYDRDGLLIIDSASLYVSGEVMRKPAEPREEQFFLIEWWNWLMISMPGDSFAIYQEYGPNEGKRYPEVEAALNGNVADIARVDQSGRMVITVAVPVQRQHTVIGVLLLSTQPGDIDSIVTAERLSILRIALVAAAVTSILSFLLAGTIAGPMRKLSDAAENAGTSMNARTEIPDFTERGDEIGYLSGALRSMTDALYDRIEAIERFAADVAHELKNPLTSLRSAVETLPRTKKPEDRERLIAIIQHDVRRLDRLISDISNASRLDAELAREAQQQVDLDQLLSTLCSMHADMASKNRISVVYEKNTGRALPRVFGQDSRLAQVVNNLLDNAVSFSPEGGTVTATLTAEGDQLVLTVADEGPGIRGDAARIFGRFYTDRPDAEGFGDHSGLGLSISKQIVEAHKGSIVAQNRRDRSGAVFTVRLPQAKK
jgi:two-component system, OmpR family, sensor histidine kinase ChvG